MAKHIPTPETHDLVKRLAGLGVTMDVICYAISPTDPIPLSELYKTYNNDIKLGKAIAQETVASMLQNVIQHGGKEGVTAAIFYLKAQAGWNDRPANVVIEPTQEFFTVLQKANSNGAATGKSNTPPGTHAENEGGRRKGAPSTEISTENQKEDNDDAQDNVIEFPAKRGRGRPRKQVS